MVRVVANRYRTRLGGGGGCVPGTNRVVERAWNWRMGKGMGINAKAENGHRNEEIGMEILIRNDKPTCYRQFQCARCLRAKQQSGSARM